MGIIRNSKKKKDQDGETPFEVHSAKISFRRDSDTIKIQITRFRDSKTVRIKSPFPEEININELNWIKYRGRGVVTYYREQERVEENRGYRYKDSSNEYAPEFLSARLEKELRKFLK